MIKPLDIEVKIFRIMSDGTGLITPNYGYGGFVIQIVHGTCGIDVALEVIQGV